MIKLVEVNQDNWHACVDLPTSEAHRWVAPNLYSIAEAQFYPKAHAYGVYTDEHLVGFTMYGPDEDNESILCVDRLMIAEPYRGQGYGSAVLKAIIKEATVLGVTGVRLSTSPENTPAKHVYEKIGFRATGEMDGDEEVYVYPIAPDTSAASQDEPATLFPEPITRLPEADIPLAGVKAYLSQAENHQIIFMQFDQEVDLPEHAHAAQVGIVLEGNIELEIDGQRHTYTKGERYYIPAGFKHAGTIHAGYADVTFFDEPARYRTKEP